MQRYLIAIALVGLTGRMAIAATNDPPMGDRTGVPPSAGSGSRAIEMPSGWCRWGQDPKRDGCDNLGSGVGG